MKLNWRKVGGSKLRYATAGLVEVQIWAHREKWFADFDMIAPRATVYADEATAQQSCEDALLAMLREASAALGYTLTAIADTEGKT